MVVILKCNNGIVTDKYLELIGESFLEKDKEVNYISNIKDIKKFPKDSTIVVARIADATKLIIRGYKRIVMWFQGIEPEESYMIHKNYIRYTILSILEYVIIKKSKFYFFVSQEMKRHYEKKYKVVFKKNKYYCMPCLNTNIQKTTFFTKDKYNLNYFAYVGSMAPWQKFDNIIKVYKKIEKMDLPNTKLFVFTAESNKAEELLEKENIENYIIDYVENDKLPKALEKIKFGFIIRENTSVNRVATPTKISTYLSCGIIPIYSKCLIDFKNIASNMKYTIGYDEYSNFNKECFEKFQDVQADDIYREYKTIFDTYYGYENHKINIAKLIKNL